LKPEKATNFNLGLVLNPLQNLNVTLDAYQISIRDRIVAGGNMAGEAAIEALEASGLPVSPTIAPANVSAWYFTNGANTRTRGADLTSVYHVDYGGFGKVDWDFAANLNTTRITHLAYQDGEPELNAGDIAALTTVTPKNKEILGGTWYQGKWSVGLHETRWGSTTDQLTYFAGPDAFSVTQFYPFKNAVLFTTDFSVRYDITKNLQASIGANNAFDRYPSKIPFITQLEGNQYDGASGQNGYDGGYYYLSVRYQF
jgi:iron complex outermembrane receptor protein